MRDQVKRCGLNLFYVSITLLLFFVASLGRAEGSIETEVGESSRIGNLSLEIVNLYSKRNGAYLESLREKLQRGTNPLSPEEIQRLDLSRFLEVLQIRKASDSVILEAAKIVRDAGYKGKIGLSALCKKPRLLSSLFKQDPLVRSENPLSECMSVGKRVSEITLKKVIEVNPNWVNAETDQCLSPLYSALKNHVFISYDRKGFQKSFRPSRYVAVLSQFGVDPNSKLCGERVLDLFLKEHVDVSYKGSEQELMKTFQPVLKQYLQIRDLDLSGHQQNLILRFSKLGLSVRLLSKLVKKGADLNNESVNFEDQTIVGGPMQVAFLRRNDDSKEGFVFLRSLLKAGVDPRSQFSLFYLEETDVETVDPQKQPEKYLRLDGSICTHIQVYYQNLKDGMPKESVEAEMLRFIKEKTGKSCF